eukprot:gene4849-5484_t
MSQPPAEKQQEPLQPPPGYSQPPPPGYNQAQHPPQGYNQGPPPATTTVVMAQPVITVPHVAFNTFPVQITCPRCQANVMTAVTMQNGLMVWLAAGGMCLVGWSTLQDYSQVQQPGHSETVRHQKSNQPSAATTTTTAQPIQMQQLSTAPPVPPVPFKTFPVTVNCPSCRVDIATTVNTKIGLMVWLSSAACCMVCPFTGLWFFPCCMDDFKDVVHRCPICNAIVGRYYRLA